MDKVKAERWVQDTFSEAYNEKKFRIFINELAGHTSCRLEWQDKTYTNDSLPKNQQESIEYYKYLCRFVDGVNEIGVFIVKLRSFKKLERERSFQRSFIASQMEKFGKDAALVAFYADDKAEWRFSYVRLQYRLSASKVDKYLTPVRRSSFLVGDTVRKHTAKRQLIKLLLSRESMSLAVLEEAFSIEPVTNEFFKEYRILYENLLSHLQERMKAGLQFKDEQGDPIEIKAEDFSKHLLGQLVFLYFLQKKGLLGAPKNRYFDQGDTNFLHNLYKKKGYKNFYDDKLTHLLHDALATDRSKKNNNDYYPLFGCKIPYLNGGLFEPFHAYDWKQPLNISNDIFENIFEIFDTYNFTVHEDEPLENEVAIDPEMLGKVFENLIPENERKGSGTFYTPREIVYYMCQESLIDYLYGCFEDTDSRDDSTIYKEIDKFVIEYELSDFIKQSAKNIDQALQDVRICDPAIGSGAFPVAMMLEITRLRIALDEAFLNEGLTAYICKLHCIENCLYGIDNEASAVDIARLRFWLSLTIEEETRKIEEETNGSQDDRVVPLPNLDYKIIQGDALRRKDSENLFSPRLRDVVKLMKEYFSEGDKEQKLTLREGIEAEIQALLKKGRDMRLYFSDVFDKSARDNRPGFDIIIANPPYIQLHKEIEKEGGEGRCRLGELYEKYKYKSWTRNGDIYALFYERAIRDLLRVGGRLAFITSNKWMRANYGKELRNTFIEKTTPLALIDLGSNAFDTATVDTNIIILSKQHESSNKPEDLLDEKLFASIVYENRKDGLREYISKNTINMPLPQYDKQWLILSESESQLLKKIESKGKFLKILGVKIDSGIKTGHNEIFVIDRETRARLIDEDPKSEELIKPILRGKNIKKWQPDWKELYVILAKHGSHKYLEKDYPIIYQHLFNHKEVLEKRGQCRYGGKGNTGQHHWLELDNNPTDTYLNSFKKEKIIYPELNQSCSFVYDKDNYYLLNSAYMMTSDSFNLKNLTAFLNSNISQFWLFHNCTSLGNRGRRMLETFLRKLPASEKITDCHELGEITDAITKGEDIQTNEARLNQILYKLYDLTKDEIEILEKTAQLIKA